MQNHIDHIDHRIMEVIIRSPNGTLDEVVLQCEDLGLRWNQVFLTVDRLSRSGELQLKLERPGVYTLRIPEHVGIGLVRSGLGVGCQSHDSETVLTA